MTQPTRKRKQISLDIKFAIIKQHNDGMRPVDIEKLYEYTSSTVSTIIKNKDKIVKEYENNVAANGAKRNKLTMQIHRPKYHEIDKAVDTWFAESISQTNVVIGGPEIKEQALRFAVFLQQPEFTASNGWLQKFREFLSPQIKLFKFSHTYNMGFLTNVFLTNEGDFSGTEALVS